MQRRWGAVPPLLTNNTGMLKLAGLFAGLAAFALYLRTLAPSAATLFDDSLEFQLATYLLAIPHPTGYPLYALLGKGFTLLPVGDVAYRVNLMSAVFGALSISAIFWLITCSTGEERVWPRLVGGLSGALALGVSPAFWSQATIAEVYTLDTLFLIITLMLLFRLSTPRLPSENNRTYVALFFVYGLSLTHHRTMLLLAPALALTLWRGVQRERSFWNKTHVATWVLAFVLPLTLYLYLPLRGHIGSLDGRYENSLAGFLRHISASDYGVFLLDDPFALSRGGLWPAHLFLEQLGVVGILAGLGGLWLARRRPWFASHTLAFLCFALFPLFYRVADFDVFFISAFALWAVWIGQAAAWLAARLQHTQSIAPKAAAGCLLLAIPVQAGVLAFSNFEALDRSEDWQVYEYGRSMLRQPMPQGSAIIGILGEMTLVRYFQETAGMRPDLHTVAADDEQARLAAVERELERGRSVFLTRTLPGATERYYLNALGPLIEVNEEPLTSPPPDATPRDEAILPEVALAAYAVSTAPTRTGEHLVELTFFWEVVDEPKGDYKVSVRLLKPDGSPAAIQDLEPVHFAYPTSFWKPGTYVRDAYELWVEPGQYTPMIIWYDPARDNAELSRTTLPPLDVN